MMNPASRRIPHRLIALLVLGLVASSCTSDGAADAPPAEVPGRVPLDDDNGSGSVEPVFQQEPSTGDTTPAATSGEPAPEGAPSSSVEFAYVSIDPDPSPSDGCCLDEIAVGDIDGDGAPDVVTGAENGDGLTWYRNPGTGTIAGDWERWTIGEGSFTTDAEAIDVDGDGDIDIVASAIDRDVVEWWEQAGDPTTSDGWVRRDIGATFAHDLEVGDFDGDGDIDVAAFHKDDSRVAWFAQPANPDDAWTQSTIDEVAGEGLDVGDIDGDGDMDLAAGPAVYVNEGGGESWTRDVVAEDWPEQARPVIADINADGIGDVVLGVPEDVGRLSWFQGPDWTENSIVGDTEFTHSLEVGDVDGDGHVDVFAGEMHFAATAEVTVFFGDGGATWRPLVLAVTGTHNARLVDLDGNGTLDVVGKNFDGPKQVEAWYTRVQTTTAPAPAAGGSTLEGFQYVEVDGSRESSGALGAYFGLAFGDVDGDGRDDIVSGNYVYENPGPDLTAPWKRTKLDDVIGTEVDAMLVADLDGDRFTDIIATALPDVWWIETDGSGWQARVVASVPATGRPNGQGYRLGDLVGDDRPEIVLSGGPGESEVWYVELPDDPDVDEWTSTMITSSATDEQVGIGDIDGDGDNDVAAGDMKGDGSYIAWFENPGDGSADWVRHRLGEFPGVYPDRLDLVDLDGDGRLDVVVTEENGGEAPDAEVMWYRQPDDPTSSDWSRSVVVTQYSTNGLDVADFDSDGDLDLVTGEHRGTLRVAIWENLGADDNGEVTWSEHPVDEGKESHLGARVWDLDGDGDLEIVSIGFDDTSRLHLWVNT